MTEEQTLGLKSNETSDGSDAGGGQMAAAKALTIKQLWNMKLRVVVFAARFHAPSEVGKHRVEHHIHLDGRNKCMRF